MKKIFLALLVVFSVFSCNRGRIYGEREELPNMVWDMNNILKFEVPVLTDTVAYDIKIDLRTVDFYTSANLWLFLKIETPSGKVMADTLECMLYDDKGNPQTQKMSFGELEDYEFMFKENVKFSETGVYKFNIQHGMRTEQLPYIKEVGLIVEKHEK